MGLTGSPANPAARRLLVCDEADKRRCFSVKLRHLESWKSCLSGPDPNLLSSHGVLNAAKYVGRQVSQRLLQAINQKFATSRDAGPPCSVPLYPSTGPDPNLLSSHGVLNAAKYVGRQVSQRLLQAINQKFATSIHDSGIVLEGEDVGVVEVLALRRQLSKMSRRLAGLEKQSAAHRQTELVLFTLLDSDATLMIHMDHKLCTDASAALQDISTGTQGGSRCYSSSKQDRKERELHHSAEQRGGKLHRHLTEPATIFLLSILFLAMGSPVRMKWGLGRADTNGSE
ncbi:hypothetical protein EOD39_17508 [Acipenser ruthenus]|uniref:Mff-like domain-containing protein n=1 Tax=Acipenser ruthenus TaxID=7906 RepID=A0A444V378_ACIRT|nr:hypothetical protein EOD39_17508 [Acipenser ruthenus]